MGFDRRRRVVVLLLLALTGALNTSVADDLPWDAYCTDPHTACRWSRTGNAQATAWYAVPSRARHDVGYYVGGGTAIGGEGRRGNEGTWGWDYSGFVVPHRIALNWSHGRRYQGGRGAYRTDGPRVIRPEGERTTPPY